MCTPSSTSPTVDRNWWIRVALCFAIRLPNGAEVATSPNATDPNSIRYAPIPAARRMIHVITSRPRRAPAFARKVRLIKEPPNHRWSSPARAPRLPTTSRRTTGASADVDDARRRDRRLRRDHDDATHDLPDDHSPGGRDRCRRDLRLRDQRPERREQRDAAGDPGPGAEPASRAVDVEPGPVPGRAQSSPDGPCGPPSC